MISQDRHLVRRPWPSTRASCTRDGCAAPGVPEPAPRRPEHDTSCVRCTGRPLRRAAWPPPRRVSGPRTAPNTACRRPRLVPSRSMPGRASGGAAVARLMGLDERYNVDRETSRAAHAGFTPTCLASSSACLQEFVPSSRLIPSSPATFPCTSMIRCAFLSSFSSRAFRRSSLRTFSSSGFRSGLRPRFFDRAFSDPMRRLAPRRQVRRSTGPLAAGLDPPRRARCTEGASSTIRSLYDGLNRRRSGLSTTSGSARAAALRLASPVPGALPFSSILSRSPNMFVFSAFGLL